MGEFCMWISYMDPNNEREWLRGVWRVLIVAEGNAVAQRVNISKNSLKFESIIFRHGAAVHDKTKKKTWRGKKGKLAWVYISISGMFAWYKSSHYILLLILNKLLLGLARLKVLNQWGKGDWIHFLVELEFFFQSYDDVNKMGLKRKTNR